MTQPQVITAVTLAEASRRVQADLRTQLAKDVARAWPALNPSKLSSSWPTWLRIMKVLLGRYHKQTSGAAGAYFRAVRQLEVGEPGVPTLALPPSDAWLERALGFAGPGKIDTYTKLGVPERTASVRALTVVQGTAQRIALDGQRTTILDSVEQDSRARWYRLTDANPCPFCALLASRGAVYRSRETGSFKSHNDCGCTAAVTFTGQVKLTGAAAKASNIYFGMKHSPDYDPDKTLLQNFRKAWTAHAPAADAAA